MTHTAFEYTKVGLMNLLDFRSSLTFLGTKPALAFIDTKKLHDGISQIVANALDELIELIKTTPENLQDEVLTSKSPRIPMIFFSYSHDDDKERDTLNVLW